MTFWFYLVLICSAHCAANAYIYGAGVEQDVSQGMEYLHLGADAGDPQAQFSLGNRYCRGEGVERDSVRGFEYLRMAAEQGTVIIVILATLSSEVDCALSCRTRQGTVQRRSDAVHWCRSAREQA